MIFWLFVVSRHHHHVGWKERMGVRSSFSETRAGGQVGWDRWVGGPGGRGRRSTTTQRDG